MIASIGVTLLLSLGCDRAPEADSKPGTQAPEATPLADKQALLAGEHEHGLGPLGGVLTSLGDDAYHAEAVIEPGEVLSIYVRPRDETQLYEVPHQVLTAYLRRDDSRSSSVIALNADPLPGSSPGMTSRFSGGLPENLGDESLYVMIPGLRIEGERYALRFQLDPATNQR
ncbi:MAG: hypothetical protein ACO1RT_17070 [Planctomycetaceae bacterium]